MTVEIAHHPDDAKSKKIKWSTAVVMEVNTDIKNTGGGVHECFTVYYTEAKEYGFFWPYTGPHGDADEWRFFQPPQPPKKK